MSENKTGGNILVCVDGSDYTEPSLLHASWLGTHVDADKLIVTHIADVTKYQVPFVNELGAGIGLQPCNGLFSEIHKQEQELLEDLKIRVSKCMNETPWCDRYDFVVERGRPAEVLHASRVPYAYVVLGKRGESFSYDQVQLGSNLSHFLKHSSVPCLLSSRSFQPITKVALVLAEDCEWESVIKWAQNSVKLDGLEFHVIHSWKTNRCSLESLQSSIPASKAGFFMHEIKNCEDSSIINKVCDVFADLMIIGAHRGSHFFDWMSTPLGKTVIRDCKIPILVTRNQSDM